MFAQKMIATMAVVFTATALQIQTGAELGDQECEEAYHCPPNWTCEWGQGDWGHCSPPPPPTCAAKGAECEALACCDAAKHCYGIFIWWELPMHWSKKTCHEQSGGGPR